MPLETDSRRVIKRLKSEAGHSVAQKGFHHQFEKGKLRVTVVHPRMDMSIDTARAIARTAGWL
ncbi:MAG: type II toxin-antitoxin system HicA family toxin [Boseongicola sp.]|nr:type II toxin-antitoxin system HicA family toxin [Boseongicola sp.]MDE0345843.1 type II toxin-antitoxin system HicA family toxin [Boseongicola sp.]